MDKAITLYSVQERHHPTKDPTSHCLPQARGDLRGAGGCPASAARARSTKSQVAADPQVGQRQKVAGPTATTAAQPGDTAPHGAQQEDETSSGTPRRSRRCPPMAPSPSLPVPVLSAGAARHLRALPPARSLRGQRDPDMAARPRTAAGAVHGRQLAPSFLPSLCPSQRPLPGRTAYVVQPPPLFKHLRPAPRTWAASARGRAESSRPGARRRRCWWWLRRHRLLLHLLLLFLLLPRCREPRLGLPEPPPLVLRGVRQPPGA